VIANAHFHKVCWQNHVKTWFNQAARKQRRRAVRAKKAAAIAPRPTAGLLRPVVHPPTIKYNYKLRQGRGFTFAELKEAGFGKKEALSLGISSDGQG
jgi:large subunit ribosomal protein L13e